MRLMAKKRLKHLTGEYRLNARTHKSVFRAMGQAVDRLASDSDLRFRGRKLGKEAFINCAVLYLSEMDAAQQERILRPLLLRLESYLLPEDGEETNGDDAETTHDVRAGHVASERDPRTGQDVNQRPNPRKRSGA